MDEVGSILAVLVSWHLNHDILWAIVHGLLGWIYLVYVVICHFIS